MARAPLPPTCPPHTVVPSVPPDYPLRGPPALTKQGYPGTLSVVTLASPKKQLDGLLYKSAEHRAAWATRVDTASRSSFKHSAYRHVWFSPGAHFTASLAHGCAW